VSLSLLFDGLPSFAQCNFSLAKQATNNCGFTPQAKKLFGLILQVLLFLKKI
jgi:hypothetical protein